MKSVYTLSLSLLIFAVSIYLTAFTPSQPNYIKALNRNQKIATYYLNGLGQLASSAQTLHQLAENLQAEPQQIAKLREQLTRCRLEYKKVEFLAEYYAPEFIKIHINGAPLPSLATATDAVEVAEPSGLQILEEIIFSENPLEDKESLLSLTGELSEDLEEFSRMQKVVPFYDRQIFEASRYQMIRVLSMGLTGYDTPVTLNAIPEAETSLRSVYMAIQTYFPQLEEKNRNDLSQNLDQDFQGALQYLQENQDFEQFDRLYFLEKYLNPLFRNIKEAHLVLGFETIDKTTPSYIEHSLDYMADNIFSEDLINPFFYTDLTKEKYTAETIELGRMLFYDPILSENLERSCASCHQPDKAFTDGKKKSIATDFKGTVERNAPTLLNSVYADRYFYDLRADKLEGQVEHVVYNDKEFNTSLMDIIQKISESEEYVSYFKKAYPELGARAVIPYSISTALSAYVTSLSGYTSPFDQYVRGEQEEISESVKRGFNIFMGKAGCGTCHFAPTFSGLIPPLFHENESEILGVPSNKDFENPELDQDPGRAKGMMKERVEIYTRAFKTTTVRNVALTAPYMHNGVYDSLEEVITFYNLGGGAGMGLEVPYQTLPPDHLELTEQEQQDLVAFMEALTDQKKHIGAPEKLPAYPEGSAYNARKVGGKY